MIRSVWAVLCEKVIEDKNSQNTSLIEALHRIAVIVPPNFDFASELPIQSNYTCGTLWFNEGDQDGVFLISMTIVSPLGIKTDKAVYEVEVKAGAFWKWFIRVHSLLLTGPGIYKFVFRAKEKGKGRWKHSATIPLAVEYKVHEKAYLVEVNLPLSDTDEAT